MPGLYLQKITTNVPDDEQLEVAIISLKAVLVDPEAPYIEGKVDSDGNLVEEVRIEEEKKQRAVPLGGVALAVLGVGNTFLS